MNKFKVFLEQLKLLSIKNKSPSQNTRMEIKLQINEFYTPARNRLNL